MDDIEFLVNAIRGGGFDDSICQRLVAKLKRLADLEEMAKKEVVLTRKEYRDLQRGGDHFKAICIRALTALIVARRNQDWAAIDMETERLTQALGLDN